MTTGNTTTSKGSTAPEKAQDGKNKPAPQPVFRDYASI